MWIQFSRQTNFQHKTTLVFCWLLLIAGIALPERVFAQTEDEHVVQRGETLSEVAQTHDTDEETLKRLNGLSDNDFVWVGQRLQLPETVSSTLSSLSDDVDGTVTYIVQAGDSLSSVAVAYRTTVAYLSLLNRIAATQPLRTGQKLLVPFVAASPNLEGQIHIVQPGEQLGVIARQYGVSTAVLVRANRLANASLITSGQELVIPATEETTNEDIGKDIAVNEDSADAYHRDEEIPTETEKWIDVDLSEQRVVAYEGKTAVNAFIISSGLPKTPTVKGTFRIWAKTSIQDMSGGSRAAGDYYYLKDVQWVQYFYEEYAFHTAYWHNNFGQPMSRGCINMRNQDAKWLYEWASPTYEGKGWLNTSNSNPGTLVLVHD